MSARKRILVIGAGPKAVALAAKAQALGGSSEQWPEIHLIDRNQVAANWTGLHGYTDGAQVLATSPLRDVGFPYRSQCWGDSVRNREIDSKMLAFSWPAFLVHDAGKRTRSFADWVDRGSPQPSLKQWAEYLDWVYRSTAATLHHMEVTEIDIEDGKWLLHAEDPDTHHHVPAPLGDALVITGPGPAKKVPGYTTPTERMTDAQHLWKGNIISEMPPDARVAVVGDGGAASSVIMTLLDQIGPDCEITVISQSGVTYTRGESYDENRHYSDATYWSWLDGQSRKRFIQHTARGVFSIHAKSRLNEAENVTTVSGDIKDISEVGNQVEVVYSDPKPDESGFMPSKREDEAFDYAIIAVGFDELWWTHKLTNRARELIGERINSRNFDMVTIGNKINSHLELEGLSPALHLPMLAGYRQGPGFPGLGCLGLLSDQILSFYS
ncbi:lysine 6-monooxygenase [Streptomyces pseudogriseolus]|nr:lysine 6-monooxygenase [Streptomyces gancidicus]